MTKPKKVINLPGMGMHKILDAVGEAAGHERAYLRRYVSPPKLPCKRCNVNTAPDVEFLGKWQSLAICNDCEAELDAQDRREAEQREFQARREAFGRRLEAAGLSLSVADCQYPLDPRWTRFIRESENTSHDRPRAWGGWIWGPPGTGKSTEAGLIVRHYLRQGWTARFVSEEGLVKSLDKGGGMSREKWRQLDLLVIDDLGARSLAPWEHDRIAEVVDLRMCCSRAPTILTSNLPLADWADSNDAYKGRSLDRILVAIGGAKGHHVQRMREYRKARAVEVEL